MIIEMIERTSPTSCTYCASPLKGPYCTPTMHERCQNLYAANIPQNVYRLSCDIERSRQASSKPFNRFTSSF